MLRIVPALPRDRFDVRVGLLGRGSGVGMESLRQAGIAVQPLPLRHAFDLRGWRNLRHALSAAQPRVVHAWGASAVRAAHALASRAPHRIASAVDPPRDGLSRWLTTNALRRCDRVVPTTWAEAERYRRLGVSGDLLTLISPCVVPPPPPRPRDVILRELGLPPHARFIVVAGRLESGSRMKDAIWTFDILRYEARDLHLVIIGEGPDRTALEEFVHAIAFDDRRVCFVGTEARVADMVPWAELVWVLDERGAVDRALEAMAAGRPVVGWRTPELADVVVDGETGWLADPSERAQLSVKTYPLVHDDGVAARLGAAAREHAARRFSLARAVEQWSRLYEEVAASGRP